MERFVAAAVQMASGPDREANVTRASALVREAAARGAQLVVLPEVFAWRGPRTGEAAHTEPVPGPTSEVMAAVARECRVHLCAGSFLEAVPGEPRAYNTSCLFDPAGRLLARYRKLHLFDVDLPGRVSVRESDTRAPGGDLVTVATALGTLGLSICYDLRFPELYRPLAARGDSPRVEFLGVARRPRYPRAGGRIRAARKPRAMSATISRAVAGGSGASRMGRPTTR